MKPRRRIRLTSGHRVRFADALGEAQGWLCPICGQPMDPNLAPSVDHVHPRRGKQARTGLYRNALGTHFWCNNAKGDREPTGCELIWLAAVNARLGVGYTRMRAVLTLPPSPTLADLWPESRR